MEFRSEDPIISSVSMESAQFGNPSPPLFSPKAVLQGRLLRPSVPSDSPFDGCEEAGCRGRAETEVAEN